MKKKIIVGVILLIGNLFAQSKIKIENNHFLKHIQEAAKKKWHSHLPDEIITAILKLTESHSYYVNVLCDQLWEMNKKPTLQDVEANWDKVLLENRGKIIADLEPLNTNRMKVVTAVALLGTVSEPNSKLFLIWGHSHLLGAGIKGKINKFKRKFKDYLLGYYRFSAYNMNEENMRRAALEMLDFHPDYIIGYSVVLDSFVRANRDLITELRKIGVKVVIGAAESFPSDNTEEILGKMFNCPVGMEYGSVETNLIAHTHPDGGYKVFWQNYFVEAIDNGLQNGKIIRVTSLYPRCFPLIRYEIGDAAQLFEGDNGIGLTRFQKVIGRCNLSVNLKDGSIIHSEVFTHALRDCEGIIRYQVIQNKDSILQLPIFTELFAVTVAPLPIQIVLFKSEDDVAGPDW